MHERNHTSTNMRHAHARLNLQTSLPFSPFTTSSPGAKQACHPHHAILWLCTTTSAVTQQSKTLFRVAVHHQEVAFGPIPAAFWMSELVHRGISCSSRSSRGNRSTGSRTDSSLTSCTKTRVEAEGFFQIPGSLLVPQAVGGVLKEPYAYHVGRKPSQLRDDIHSTWTLSQPMQRQTTDCSEHPPLPLKNRTYQANTSGNRNTSGALTCLFRQINPQKSHTSEFGWEYLSS